MIYLMKENLNRSDFEKESSERRRSEDLSRRSSLLSAESSDGGGRSKREIEAPLLSNGPTAPI